MPSNTEANKGVSMGPKTAKDEVHRRKVESLDRKILDLELLNNQAVSIIHRMQSESMEKSKKILRVESGINRAKVITKSSDLLKPKIEMTSLVKPQAKRASSVRPRQAQLDLVKIYEQRNEKLEQEVTRLQKKLQQAQEKLRNIDKNLDGGLDARGSASSTNGNHVQSAYMFKLIQENERLKSQLDSASKCYGFDPAKVVLTSKHHPYYGNHCNLARSCEDIRSAVEQSHLMMHNKCLRNQVGSF